MKPDCERNAALNAASLRALVSRRCLLHSSRAASGEGTPCAAQSSYTHRAHARVGVRGLCSHKAAHDDGVWAPGRPRDNDFVWHPHVTVHVSYEPPSLPPSPPPPSPRPPPPPPSPSASPPRRVCSRTMQHQCNIQCNTSATPVQHLCNIQCNISQKRSFCIGFAMFLFNGTDSSRPPLPY